LELSAFSATTPEAITPAMNEARVWGAEAINVLATPLFFFNRQTVMGRAEALRLPAMYQWPEMAEEGGFAGYEPRITQWFRQLARLLAKVLRGGAPSFRSPQSRIPGRNAIGARLPSMRVNS
jgi:putative ABC transport system substrate-binding protein